MLNEVISKEMTQGAAGFDPGDCSILEQNVIQLLQKPVPYKKGWVTRIPAVRQCAHQKRCQDNKLALLSKKASILYQWLTWDQNHLPPRKRARREDATETATIMNR
jgi:hypothetical protein